MSHSIPTDYLGATRPNPAMIAVLLQQRPNPDRAVGCRETMENPPQLIPALSDLALRFIVESLGCTNA